MNTMVTIEYQGYAITYQDDGWFNATQAAAKFGKVPAEWLRLPSTLEYIAALKRHQSDMGKTHITRKGNSKNFQQGTWLHPKLAVPFARWLDPDFAVWCDAQIDNLIRKKDDWRKLRHVSTVSSKSMDQTLYEVRKAAGKDTQSHHYVNEHRLINSLLTGEYEDLNRNALPISQLDFLAYFEIRNSIMIGMGLSYEQRKEALKVEALAWREAHAIPYPVIVAPTMAPRQLALALFDET